MVLSAVAFEATNAGIANAASVYRTDLVQGIRGLSFGFWVLLRHQELAGRYIKATPVSKGVSLSVVST